MSTPSLKVVVAITSPIAFHQLKNQTILSTCIKSAQGFVATISGAHLAIAGTAADLAKVSDIDCEKIVCDPNKPGDLAGALRSAEVDLVMIHDSQRPLTNQAQFERVYAALVSGIDAVRPVSPFTETLKSIDASNFIDETIDRNSMMRVSTPELIRYSAIDFGADASTWFVPLTKIAKTAVVEADPDSARINSEKEIELMSYLLDWNK
ncbi:MAG: 2-C-methyl-D-erythritol 4-phosphate cytidylyltransferase [Candidatus Planktophila sp.]